ncbi:MAG: glycosyltransferase, partial [Nitrosospira sp.]|nr:glycosyltransferase [Nitrosospira sp.]
MSAPTVDSRDSRIGVIHSYPIWLPQTQTWMYHQFAHLPAHVDAHVVCERTEHLDQFGVPNMHSLDRAGIWRHGLDRAMRKLRLRRHMGLLERVARRHRLGVLHSHFGNVGWADSGAARARGLKHVVTFYGRDVNMLPAQEPIWRRRYRELFASAHLFLCEGPHMVSQLIALGCPAERVRLHHLG